jgi:hypothetical protein
MKFYEFSTHVTYDSKLNIPTLYQPNLTSGQAVRVIVLLNDLNVQKPVVSNQSDLFSLEDVITQIQKSLQDSTLIQPGSGLLAEHLSHSPEKPDPLFDVKQWNLEWDDIEAKMKAMDILDESKVAP